MASAGRPIRTHRSPALLRSSVLGIAPEEVEIFLERLFELPLGQVLLCGLNDSLARYRASVVEILTGAARFTPERRRGAPGSSSPRLGNHSVVAQAVLRTGTVSRESLPVLGRSVPLVLLETVGGDIGGQLVEHPVALHLRDDRRGRHRRTERVAVHDRQLGNADAGNETASKSRASGWGSSDRIAILIAARLARRMSPEVDLRGRSPLRRRRRRRARGSRRETLAAVRVQALRVVESQEDAARRQDDGRRDDRAGERTASGFVDAGDARVSASRSSVSIQIEVAKTAQLREKARRADRTRHGDRRGDPSVLDSHPTRSVCFSPMRAALPLRSRR